MAIAVLLMLAGTAVLAVGAEAAIRGAGRFAEARGLSPFVLGALLFGIDVESLGATLLAAGRGQTSIAAGSAFGTVVFLFSVAFGAALLLSPKPIESPSQPMVLYPSVAVLAGALALSDQTVSRLEGSILVLLYLFYIVTVVREGKAIRTRGEIIQKEAEEGPHAPAWLLLVGGLGLVYLGANLLVDGGVRILHRTGLSAGFVGAAIIGALAAADEVLLETLPVLRGMPGLATGNLFGTVAAFSTGVIGLAALIHPLIVDAAATSAFLAAAVLYTIVAVAFLVRGRAGRLVGLIVLVAYGLWLALSYRF